MKYRKMIFPNHILQLVKSNILSSFLKEHIMSYMAPSRSKNIPAWKKIGLKLKLDPAQTGSVDSETTDDGNLKGKSPTSNCINSGSKLLKNRETDLANSKSHLPHTPGFSRKKSVRFFPESNLGDGERGKNSVINTTTDPGSPSTSRQEFTTENTSVAENKDTSRHSNSNGQILKRVKRSKEDVVRSSKELGRKVASSTPKDAPPFLKYLREYSESKQTWKFKKNHQTHLLRHVFDVRSVPSDHAHLIYDYIRGLKGQVRTRLRDEALKIKVKDQEDGAAGFQGAILNLEQSQKEYEAAISEYLTTNLSSRVHQMGHEESFLLEFQDETFKNRIVMRTRAEMILNELALSLDGDVTSHQDGRSKGLSKQAEVNDKTPARISRKRKQRTLDSSDTSSNVSSSTDDDEESSDNVSSTSSSSSESDSDSDIE